MTTPPLRMDTLDLDALPTGEISRCLVGVSHDQLGAPVRCPVLVARGTRPGPVVGITAALHGNELNGIPVIHRLFEGLDPTRLRGTIVAVVVANVPGFQRRQRTFLDGQDINHLFPGKPDGNGGEVYAWNLVQRLVDRFDLLLDLHTASMGRINCLYIRADLTDPHTADMSWRLRPDIVLHNPPNDRTLRGTAMARGTPAITVEIGNPQRYHPEYVRHTLVGIRRILAAHGMLPRRKVADRAPPVICSHSTWLYTDRGGLLEVLPDTTEAVSEGQVIARMRDMFGTVQQEYRAPWDGVVIGRSVDPVAESGARILHLGAVTDAAEAGYLPWNDTPPDEAPPLRARPSQEHP